MSRPIPWPTYWRTTEYPLDSTKVWTAAPMSPMWLPGLGGGDAEVERLACRVDQTAAPPGDGLAARDREPAVGPPAVEDQPAVERHEVAVLDHQRAGNAVDDLVVDRDAQRVGESLVPEEARDAVVIPDERLRLAVEIEGRDPGAYGARQLREAGAEDLPGDPHLLDLIRPLQSEAVDCVRAHALATASTVVAESLR